MKESTEVKKGKNLIHPTNTSLTEKELFDEIKKAEESNFITVEEGMKDVEQWRKQGKRSSFISRIIA